MLLQILIQFEVCHCNHDLWFEAQVETFYSLDWLFLARNLHMITMDSPGVELPEDDDGLSVAALQGLVCDEP